MRMCSRLCEVAAQHSFTINSKEITHYCSVLCCTALHRTALPCDTLRITLSYSYEICKKRDRNFTVLEGNKVSLIDYFKFQKCSKTFDLIVWKSFVPWMTDKEIGKNR